MTLTAADVAEIMRLVEQSGFDELNLEIDGTKISLRRGSAAQTTAPTPATEPAPPPGPLPAPLAAGTGTDPSMQDLPSPLLGTFYRAPKPGAPPFVEVGAQVSEDTIVGIIEVMKLMNTVRAGAKGSVREILASDGVLVEFGQPLLRIDKSP